MSTAPAGPHSMDLSRLERAIEEGPDDPTRYAVLGDVLSQAGDPRGELIALQLEPRRTPAQRTREHQLLAHPHIRVRRPRRAQWRWGFVHTLAFEAAADGPPGPTWETELQRTLDAPSCRFLRELILEVDAGGPALSFLCRRAPPVLRSLHLVCNEVDLGEAAGALATVTRLVLSSQLIIPAPLPLPAVTELQLPLDALSAAGLATVLRSVGSTVRSLSLSSFDPVEPESLAAALELPHLTELTIRADVTSRATVDALLDSPLADRLEKLDVSRSGLSVEGAQRLLRRASRLPRLSSLLMGEVAGKAGGHHASAKR